MWHRKNPGVLHRPVRCCSTMPGCCMVMAGTSFPQQILYQKAWEGGATCIQRVHIWRENVDSLMGIFWSFLSLVLDYKLQHASRVHCVAPRDDIYCSVSETWLSLLQGAKLLWKHTYDSNHTYLCPWIQAISTDGEQWPSFSNASWYPNTKGLWASVRES